MANLLTNTSELTSIANAIRSKTGSTSSITFPSGFISEIENIGGGTSGLEYETGVYTSSSGTATQLIPFTNTHSSVPSFFAIVSTYTYALNAQVMSEVFARTESLGYTPQDENYHVLYGVVLRTYANSSGNTTYGAYNIYTSASSTDSSSTTNMRYWATESQIKLLRSSSANVYGDYKWIAIWL